MGRSTLQALVKQIDAIAENQLPLRQSDEQIVAWADLHGWNITDPAHQRLLIRQAVLDAAIRLAVPGVAERRFNTPLDLLGVQVPRSLANAIYEEALRSQATTFNFWGELYSTAIPQAYRRRIGQFWTDEQIAEWMLSWLVQFHPRCLADIGCGTGNFLRMAKRLARDKTEIELYGCDVSPILLNLTLAAFLTDFDGQSTALPALVAQDYLFARIPTGVDAVVCNPPYTRHHHITPKLKDTLQSLLRTQLRLNVSRQGTLALYFLLKTVAEMAEGTHAAFIVPMEVLDARYGQSAKRALSQYTTLSAIIHFSPQMNAFHKVDVGATILLFKKGYERHNLVRHLTLKALPATGELMKWLSYTESRDLSCGSLVVRSQDDLLEVRKWFGIPVQPLSSVEWQNSDLVVPLKALAKVVRGIATGANEFFALSTQKVKQYSLEPFVVRTLQRNREIQDIVLDEARWQALSDEGKSVWLLYLNGDDVSEHPALSAYLMEGESRGYHRRSLVQTRKKWYAMEQRDIPPIFFTILTRGNPRFVLNHAGVRPLNMFSLIYPNRYVVEADATELLWALLNSDFSLSRLHSVSRTYGGNTLKVEPRELDDLPVINPLALPEDIRREIKDRIADFYHHRQTSALIQQVNQLVDKLLAGESVAAGLSPLPLQFQLLEKGEDYEGAK